MKLRVGATLLTPGYHGPQGGLARRPPKAASQGGLTRKFHKRLGSGRDDRSDSPSARLGWAGRRADLPGVRPGLVDDQSEWCFSWMANEPGVRRSAGLESCGYSDGAGDADDYEP